MLGTPLLAGVGRAVNVRADAYALAHSREPDGLAAVLIRDWDHRSISPGPLEQALFYSHPPLAQRIRHAMAWRQAR
jgi:STE24 endopeptidase